MNNNYFSPTIDAYAPSHHYTYDTSSPSTYYYSPMFPSSCPLHSPYNFYSTTSPTSVNTSSFSFSYAQPTEMYPSPPVQQRTSSKLDQIQCDVLRNDFILEAIHPPGADRTPLRRHKCFKKHELQILHQVYIRDPHPTTDVLQQLANQLQTPLDKVRVGGLYLSSDEKRISLFRSFSRSNGSKIADTVTNRRNVKFQQLVHQQLLEFFLS